MQSHSILKSNLEIATSIEETKDTGLDDPSRFQITPARNLKKSAFQGVEKANLFRKISDIENDNEKTQRPFEMTLAHSGSALSIHNELFGDMKSSFQNPLKQSDDNNFIRRLLRDEELLKGEDKISFLVSEIENANTKIEQLEYRLSQMDAARKESGSILGFEDDLQPTRRSNDQDSTKNGNMLQTMVKLLNSKYEEERDANSKLKEDNEFLKDLIVKRTEDANNSLKKMAASNKQIEDKNKEYLIAIDKLSTEIVKLSQQQHMRRTEDQLNKELQLLKQENIGISADLKALTRRFEEVSHEKNATLDDKEYLLQENQCLKEALESKSNKLREIKKKIMNQDSKRPCESLYNKEVDMSNNADIDSSYDNF